MPEGLAPLKGHQAAVWLFANCSYGLCRMPFSTIDPGSQH
jgi:hypothetical protein